MDNSGALAIALLVITIIVVAWYFANPTEKLSNRPDESLGVRFSQGYIVWSMVHNGRNMLPIGIGISGKSEPDKVHVTLFRPFDGEYAKPKPFGSFDANVTVLKPWDDKGFAVRIDSTGGEEGRGSDISGIDLHGGPKDLGHIIHIRFKDGRKFVGGNANNADQKWIRSLSRSAHLVTA